MSENYQRIKILKKGTKRLKPNLLQGLNDSILGTNSDFAADLHGTVECTVSPAGDSADVVLEEVHYKSASMYVNI